MTKQEFVEQLAKKTGLTKKQARQAVEAFVDLIEESLIKNEKVRLTGLGTFEPYQRKAGRRINPRTKQPIEVPARVVPKFRPSAAFKRTLAGG